MAGARSSEHQEQDSSKEGFSVDIEQTFALFARPLENFLIGILKNSTEANDALQATFVKLLEKGDTILLKSALKSWLFRVAYNEAMLIKRKDGVAKKHLEKIVWSIRPESETGRQPFDGILAEERKHQIQHALQQLSAVQQEVVRKRIYEGLKFREIAEQLDLPLGTVLARMHASLKKLKTVLDNERNEE